MTDFIFLGDTKFGLFDATSDKRVSEANAPVGTIGLVEDVSNLVSPPDIEPFFVSDVTLSEGHLVQNKITFFPVEEGGDIADHVRTEPRSISISGLITDTPTGIASFFLVPDLI